MMTTTMLIVVTLTIAASLFTPVFGGKKGLEGTSAIIRNRLARAAKSERKNEAKSEDKPLLVDPHTWDPKSCAKVSNMLVNKGRVIKRIKKLMDQIEKNEAKSE